MIEVQVLMPEDVQCLYDIYEQIGQKDDKYFERCFEDGRTIFVGLLDGQVAGFGMLNWKPKYALYKKLGIPEIQDLNIVPDARQKGVATAIIQKFEELAREKKCEHIGLGVGLTKAYGPAQRLYAKLGYIPDGYGVTCDRAPIQDGGSYPVDDDLCLMLVKSL